MVEITREDFCVDEVIKKLKQPKVGAVLVYVGTVREFSEGIGLEFWDDNEAVQRLQEIEKKTLGKFDIEDVVIMHRVGLLNITESILMIAISASHRGPTFDACRSIIDDIKNLHKTWGREVRK